MQLLLFFNQIRGWLMKPFIELFLLGVATPIRLACDIISGVADSIDIGVVKKYSHEWTIRRKRIGVRNDIRSYARYMLYQARVLNTTVKMSFNDIIIYARPCTHEEETCEVERIVADYDHKWKVRSASSVVIGATGQHCRRSF
jgi:hypothetical protein